MKCRFIRAGLQIAHSWLLLFMSLTLFSCSKSEDSSTSFGLAPDDVKGKEFCLYSNPPRWSVRMISGNKPTESIIRVNSETATVSGGAVYYQKTGENTASLSCNFGTYVFIGGNMANSYHQYDLKLVFTTYNQGYYTGTYRNQPEGGKVEKTSGYFSFDTNELPDFDGIPDGEGGADQNPDIDYSLLTGSWVYNVNEMNKYLTFKSNNEYLIVISGGGIYAEESGTYTVDEEGSFVYLTAQNESNAAQYKIVSLESNKLEWEQYNVIAGEYMSPEIFVKSVSDGTENKPEEDDAPDKNLFVIYEDIDLLSQERESSDNKYGADVISTFEYADGLNHLSARLGLNTGIWYGKARQEGWAYCVGTDANVTRDNAIHIADVFYANTTLCRSEFYLSDEIKEFYIRPFVIEGGKIHYFKARRLLSRPGGIDIQLVDDKTENLTLIYRFDDDNTYFVNLSYGSIDGEAYYDEFTSISGGEGELTIPLPISRRNLESLSVYLVNHKDQVRYRTNIIQF